MKTFLIAGLVLVMVGCKTTRRASSNSSAYANYQENLNTSLPVYPDFESQLANTASANPTGSVQAVDQQLASIDQQLIQKNKSEPYFNGYSVLIYSGVNRDQAFKTQSELSENFPDLTPEMQYQAPRYLVKVGKFVYKFEAQKYFAEVKEQFPSARIIHDRFQRQEFETPQEPENNVEGQN